MATEQTTVIDVIARFKDETKRDVDQAQKEIRELGDTASSSAADMDKLSRSLEKTKKQADNLSKNKWQMRFEAIDRATATINKIKNGVTGFAGKTFQFTIRALDYATRPVRGLFNMLTSFKTLVAGVFAGMAARKAVFQPIGLADAYTSAYIGFETLFQDAERAQKMMDDLDAFAKATPFKTSNVIANSQKMLAMGWKPEDIIEDMRIIGDAAAATGKGDEGFESIVRALSQIKTKGKLSTEELNQLAEAGLRAKGYIAEGLGYGSDDAGLAKMTAELEKGLIGSDKAIEMLLQGMKEYGGMMDKTANETVEGLKSQIEDAFEISIMRKWGQGLQDGAKRGMGSIVELLNKSEASLNAFGESLKEMGSYLSNKFADGLEKTIESILKVTESDKFKNASAGEKFGILWDEVIAQPFNQWWDSTGEKWATDAAEKMGKAFANGITNAIKGVFSSSHFGGGDNWVATALTVGGISKVAGLLSPLTSGGLKAGKWLAGLGAGAGEVASAGGAVGAASGMIQAGGKGLLARLIGSTGTNMVRGSGILETAVNVGAGMGSAATTMPGLAVAGGATLAGGLFGFAGLTSAINDLVTATEERTAKGERDRMNAGIAKASMVGGGASLGAIIGSFIPVIGTAIGGAIGAGLGGLGAIVGGGNLGRMLADSADGTTAIRKSSDALKDATKAAGSFAEKRYETSKLLEQYNLLENQMNYLHPTQEALNKMQEEQKQIVSELARIYPELINQYDIENGKLGEKAGLIERMTDAEKRLLEMQLDQKLNDAEKQLPTMKNNYAENQADLDKLAGTADKYKAAEPQLGLISDRIYTLRFGLSSASSEDFQRIKKEIAEQTAEFNEILQGVDPLAGNFNFNQIANESWRDQYADVLSASLDTMQRQQELETQFQTLAEAKMQSIELELGAPLDEMAAKYDTLNQKQKDAFDGAMQSLQDYIKELEYVPDEITIKVNTIYETAHPPTYPGMLATPSMSPGNIMSNFGVGKQLGGHATGGIFGQEHVAWFAEGNRKEAVIPLEGANRERGKSIWAAAGEYLGFKPVQTYKPQTENSGSVPVATAPISVNMGGVNFTFSGNTANSSDVMAAIRAQMPTISNELAAEIAKQLRRVFHNSVAEGV